jgi:hypothetical protein
VQSKQANESRCEVALELNLHTEPLVNAPQLLNRGYENEVSTRDRLARTGADARIDESGAIGELRLAIRPYGRWYKLRSSRTDEYGDYVKYTEGPAAGPPSGRATT